jgi:cobalt-zinc-cadmium efflux system outer membrane protein
LSLDAAVTWALENNLELAALRQQHGIAAAGVVIARTYPFNPAWEAKVFGANGPESAGITNRVPTEHKILFDVEIRGQGKYRREAALATLSRADWEIAAQETALAVRVMRAFQAVVYRREKLRLLEETIRLNEEAVRDVGRLVEQGKLRSADLIVTRTELNDARTQLSTARATLATANFDLQRALGLVNVTFALEGSLEMRCGPADPVMLTQAALERRADLHARQAAVSEADARVRLEIANRYGNPTVGPSYVYDPTRINFIGAHFTLPLPVLNTHRGEVQQRKGEQAKTVLELRQLEVSINQDVQQALARVTEARTILDMYQSKILPELEAAKTEIGRLYSKGDPGVDYLRVIDFGRRLVKTRDGYLDALFELNQAQADLAAAVGDPALAIAPCLPVQAYQATLLPPL